MPQVGDSIGQKVQARPTGTISVILANSRKVSGRGSVSKDEGQRLLEEQRVMSMWEDYQYQYQYQRHS
jgi:hypothetical protein